MGEWRGCACGEGFYRERLQPRMTGERLAGYLNALSDERARAALGGRDARRAPVRERRRAAGDRGAGLVGARASRLARGVRRTPPHRRPGGSWDGLGAARASGSGGRGRGDARRAGAGERHVRGAVRARVPDLGHGQTSGRNAGRAARSPLERSGHRAARCGGRAGEDHAAPTQQTGGLMSGITTHILDIARGRPAAGVAVSLARRAGDGWTELATSRSDTNGRVANLLSGDVKSAAGTYRLRFDTGAYFGALGVALFHPFVEIVFEIRDAEQYHVPLLVSPFGYTTYRGS